MSCVANDNKQGMRSRCSLVAAAISCRSEVKVVTHTCPLFQLLNLTRNVVDSNSKRLAAAPLPSAV